MSIIGRLGPCLYCGHDTREVVFHTQHIADEGYLKIMQAKHDKDKSEIDQIALRLGMLRATLVKVSEHEGGWSRMLAILDTVIHWFAQTQGVDVPGVKPWVGEAAASEPDYRTLEEKLGPEFEERLSAVITEAYNNAYIDGPVKHAPYGCAEEQAEKLRMCAAEMMGFRV